MLRSLLELLGIYKLYERWLFNQIKNGNMPSHIAFILDGNRRWAKRQGLPPWLGHERGAAKVKKVLKWCLDLGIKTVTLYILSTENLKREPEELGKLFSILEENLMEILEDNILDEYEIRFKTIGRLDLLPNRIRGLLKKLEEKTMCYNKFFLNAAIAYGGRTEIVEAAKRLASDVKKGKIKLEDINEQVFEKYLSTSHLPNPSPDLIVRTSGEERLSNFLLWQAAYSELCFLEVYWPDFRKIDLWRAVRIYQKRQRRFGQ